MTGRFDRRMVARAGAFGLLVAAIVVLSWPFESLAPAAGIDPSWQAGLNMGAFHRLDWGRDIVWTYGPLGYLKTPLLFYGRTYEAAMLYSLAIRLATAAVLVIAIRRTLPLAVAAAVAWLGLALLQEDPALVLAVLVALLTLERPLAGRAGLAVAGGLGAWAAFELLGKISIGGLVLVVLAIAVAAPREDRRLRAAAFAGGFVASLLVLWVICGQSLGALPAYLRYSLSVVSGYSNAMGLDQGAGWHYWAAAAIGAVALYGVTVREPGRHRAAAVAVLAVFLFGEFKEAFVRHDDVHVLYLFTAALCIMPALGWGTRLARRATAVLATALVAVAVIAVIGKLSDSIHPGPSWSALRGQVGQMADKKKRDAAIAQVRASLAGFYAIDPRLLSLVAHRPTHVMPFETTAAWVYQLDWDPLPVFQDYQAYTRSLDDLNANHVSGNDGPERILRSIEAAVDGRQTAFDPPREYVQLLCNFRQLAAAGKWQVLGRIRDRCGAPTSLGPTRALGWGEATPVPTAPAHAAVVAYVDGVGVGGLERIPALLLRPRSRYVRLGGTTLFRLPPAIAGDGLLMSAPAGADFKGSFAVAPQAKSLAFYKGKGKQPSGRPLRVTFKAMPIRSGSGA